MGKVVAVRAWELQYHGLTRTGSSSSPASLLEAGSDTSSPRLQIATEVHDTAQKAAREGKAGILLRRRSVQTSLHPEKKFKNCSFYSSFQGLLPRARPRVLVGRVSRHLACARHCGRLKVPRHPGAAGDGGATSPGCLQREGEAAEPPRNHELCWAWWEVMAGCSGHAAVQPQGPTSETAAEKSIFLLRINLKVDILT